MSKTGCLSPRRPIETKPNKVDKWNIADTRDIADKRGKVDKRDGKVMSRFILIKMRKRVELFINRIYLPIDDTSRLAYCEYLSSCKDRPDYFIYK